MRGKYEYLYKRKGSQNWWVRLQNTVIDGQFQKKFEKSLGTPEIELARIRAASIIASHVEDKFWERQMRLQNGHKIQKRFEPGKMHTTPDGLRVLATTNDLTYIDKNDVVIKKCANEEVVVKTPILQTARDRTTLTSIAMRAPFTSNISAPVSKYPILEKWFHHRNVTDHIRKEAIPTWDAFARITAGKKPTQWTREDGRALAQLLIDNNNKSKTVEKKVGHLRAAVNIAIADGELVLNPFVDVVPKLHDAMKREPLDDKDMALVRTNLHRLKEEDQLLWIWLATTGMRLGEPFAIDREFEEAGVRYVIVGHKTPSSRRRIPIPDEVALRLSGRISAKIFGDGHETTGKRLRYFLRSLGISHDSKKGTGHNAKTVHSLRHRAADKLRANECPDQIRYELLGHENVTVAAGYGRGYPVTKLKVWVEKIGW